MPDTVYDSCNDQRSGSTSIPVINEIRDRSEYLLDNGAAAYVGEYSTSATVLDEYGDLDQFHEDLTPPEQTRSSDWIAHTNETVGFEISHPNDWLIEPVWTQLEIAEEDDVVSFFEGTEPSPEPLTLFVAAQLEADGLFNLLRIVVDRYNPLLGSFEFEDVVASSRARPDYVADREVDVGGHSALLVEYSVETGQGVPAGLFAVYVPADGILWGANCGFPSELESSAQSKETCEAIVMSFRLLDE